MIIRFTFDTPFGQFSDALIFEEEQPILFDAETGLPSETLILETIQPIPSDAEIETMKLERLNNWLAMVNPTVEGI